MICYSIASKDMVMTLKFKEHTVDIYIQNKDTNITDTFDYYKNNNDIIIEVNGNVLYILSQKDDCLVDERFGIKFMKSVKNVAIFN